MIAVRASEDEKDVVREFFELFKTPWQFYGDGSNYDVLICSGDQLPENDARLVLIYGNERNDFDRQNRLEFLSQRPNAILSFQHDRIPIYGKCIAFAGQATEQLVDASTRESIATEIATPRQTIIRIGFNLFGEIRSLLTHGQPIEHAAVPTLDLHIALLRRLILSHSITLLEIPPLPSGYRFAACLTHDIDHAGIRHHRFDHTIFGFLYRATIGSLVDFLRGRRSAGQLAANWRAAFSLPFVYLGLLRDFWKRFDRYTDLEQRLPSTFFVVPDKNRPGRNGTASAPQKRATRYDVSDVAEQIQCLAAANCEIGCHGIDSWSDTSEGAQELKRIQGATNRATIGHRSHWLYQDKDSPRYLEEAGFAYDSSVGYNETIGYRAGTTQVFKPLAATRILELPLHIMDTALFFPDYMNLSEEQARRRLRPILENADRFGGVLTVNWHGRSIAPERLWVDPYLSLLGALKSKGAWFATAGDAVSWFQKRRSARIDNITSEGDSIRAHVSVAESDSKLPGLLVRLHKSPSEHVDQPLNESGEVVFADLLGTP